MRQALGQVLSRLLQSNVVSSEGLKTILNQPDRYISQYRYLYRSRDTDLTQRLLQVEFNPETLKQALKTKGLVAWGADRPSVLVWLLDLDQKQWIKTERQADRHQALTVAAKHKGIPLVLPLMDLTDRQQLSYQGSELDKQVMRASKRYQTDVTLLGQLSAVADNLWDIQWTLFYAGETQQWTAKHSPLAVVMEHGIQGTYERLVLRKTPVLVPVMTVSEPIAETTRVSEFKEPNRVIPPGAVILKVSGVSNVNEFAQVTGYLKSVKQLDSHQWLQVTPDEFWFELQPHNEVARLRQSFDSSGIFQVVYTGNSEGVMHYRLLSVIELETEASDNY